MLRLVVSHTTGIAAEQLPRSPLRVRFAALFAWFHVRIGYQRGRAAHPGRLSIQLLQQWRECLKLPDFGPQPIIQPVFDGKLKLSEQIGQEIILPRNHHLRDARALAVYLLDPDTENKYPQGDPRKPRQSAPETVGARRNHRCSRPVGFTDALQRLPAVATDLCQTIIPTFAGIQQGVCFAALQYADLGGL